MALVEMIGCLIRELADSDDINTDTAQTCKQVNNLYELLLDRMLDLSTYVRTKVLAVLTKLCEMQVKFPKQRLAMTRAATVALEDKAAGVRKGAIVLIMKLIETHPYGTFHGGLLGLSEWEERYRGVKEELAKVGGGVGNAVEVEGDQQSDTGAENEQENGEEAEDDAEEAEGDATPKRRKKYVAMMFGQGWILTWIIRSKGKRVKTEDDMDVDEEEQGEGDHDDDDDETDDEEADEEQTQETDLYLDDDGDGEQHTPKKKAKAKKYKKSKKGKKGRKSELNMVALANEQAALAELEGNEVLQLRLRKKYYVEALTFIRLVEGAMEVIGQLLGSTNKAEVLEAMDFFRTAYQYQLDGVAVS